MLQVCIHSYLISVLKHKYLILDSHHPDTLCLRQQGCEDPRLLPEPKTGHRAEKFGEHCSKRMRIQTMRDLQDFYRKKKVTHAKFFLAGMKAKWDEAGGRILLGDNTGGRIVLLQPIRFKWVGVWIATGLPSTDIQQTIYVYSVPIWPKFELRRTSGTELPRKPRTVHSATFPNVRQPPVYAESAGPWCSGRWLSV
jgi:hypothetical protein